MDIFSEFSNRKRNGLSYKRMWLERQNDQEIVFKSISGYYQTFTRCEELTKIMQERTNCADSVVVRESDNSWLFIYPHHDFLLVNKIGYKKEEKLFLSLCTEELTKDFSHYDSSQVDVQTIIDRMTKLSETEDIFVNQLLKKSDFRLYQATGMVEIFS